MGNSESQPAEGSSPAERTSTTVVEVFFVGASWCGACKHTKPHWNTFVAQNPNLRTVYIDINAVQEGEQEHYARMAEAFPTFLFVHEDGHVDKVVGMRNAKQLQDLLTAP